MHNRYGHRIAVFATILVAAIGMAGEPRVDFHVISELGFRSSKPLYLAINSQNEWVALWRSQNTYSYSEAPQSESGPVPMIDFAHFTLLLASSGTKPNSGHSLAFTSVREFDAVITVSVLDIGPGSSCPTFPEIANPRVFALIPKSHKSDNFTVARAAVDCTARLIIR